MQTLTGAQTKLKLLQKKKKKTPNTLELSFLPLFSFSGVGAECGCRCSSFGRFIRQPLKLRMWTAAWFECHCYREIMLILCLLQFYRFFFLPKHTLLCLPRLATLLPQLLDSLPCQFILASQNTEQNWVDSSQESCLGTVKHASPLGSRPTQTSSVTCQCSETQTGKCFL